MISNQNPTYGDWSAFSSNQGRTAQDIPANGKRQPAPKPRHILDYYYKSAIEQETAQPNHYISQWAKYVTDIKLLSIDHDTPQNKSRGAFLSVCREIDRNHKKITTANHAARSTAQSGSKTLINHSVSGVAVS